MCDAASQRKYSWACYKSKYFFSPLTPIGLILQEVRDQERKSSTKRKFFQISRVTVFGIAEPKEGRFFDVVGRSKS